MCLAPACLPARTQNAAHEAAGKGRHSLQAKSSPLSTPGPLPSRVPALQARMRGPWTRLSSRATRVSSNRRQGIGAGLLAVLAFNACLPSALPCASFPPSRAPLPAAFLRFARLRLHTSHSAASLDLCPRHLTPARHSALFRSCLPRGARHVAPPGAGHRGGDGGRRQLAPRQRGGSPPGPLLAGGGAQARSAGVLCKVLPAAGENVFSSYFPFFLTN